MTEIKNKLYNEIKDEITILRTYKIRGKLKTIMPDDNPEYIKDLFKEKDIFIVCFDENEEVLKELKQSKLPYKLLPSNYYDDEWETILITT